MYGFAYNNNNLTNNMHTDHYAIVQSSYNARIVTHYYTATEHDIILIWENKKRLHVFNNVQTSILLRTRTITCALIK